jgi:DNA polymerase III delta subunit
MNKKAEATQIILKELKRAGISATSDQISYLIETFVYDLKADIMNASTIQIPVVKAPKTGA